MGGAWSNITGSSRKKKSRKKKRRHRRKSTSSSESSIESPEQQPRFRVDFSYPESSSKNNMSLDKKKYEKDCIRAHNEYRTCHGAKALKQSDECTKKAQEWANHLAATGKLQHSSGGKFGENLAYTSSKNATGDQACTQWYEEIKDYRFSRPGFAGNTGHFTQVVWKGSKYVGIGVAVGPKGTFTVANYLPAGNLNTTEAFRENVGQKDGSPKVGKDKSEKKGLFGRRRSRSSSSSSSSSSSDDERSKSKSKEKSGTTVETKTETYTENGRRMRKTTTITTKVTIDGGSKKTSTSTSTKIEEIGDDDKDHKKVKDGVKKLSLGDKNDKKTHGASGSNQLTKKEIEQFRKECLDRHNTLRAKHGASKLKASSDLDKKAQKWAEHLLRTNKLQHSSDGQYGENVGYKMQYPARYFTGAEITDMWYNEIKDYKFSEPKFSSNTGHFTQVVWKKSERIGVGVASKDGTTYAVANYDPPGNYNNEYRENVGTTRSK